MARVHTEVGEKAIPLSLNSAHRPEPVAAGTKGYELGLGTGAGAICKT
jgi:hypothetical protein